MAPQSIELQVQELVTDGDSRVLDLIYDQFSNMLLAILIAHLRNRTDAEDTLQQLFLDLAKKPQQLLKPRQLAPWLCTKARNLATDLQRKRNRQERRQAAWQEDFSTSHNPSEVNLEPLHIALKTIPPKQREVVLMKAFEKKSFVEIGALLGISHNTAASRYRYALETMRQLLQSA